MKRRTSNTDPNATERSPPGTPTPGEPLRARRVALIALPFMAGAVGIIAYSDSLFVPVYVTLLTLLKKLLASLTPKVLLLFAKNSLLIRIKQLVGAALAQLVVMSHRPWRRRLLALKLQLLAFFRGGIHWYRDCPLWLKAVLALLVLLLTASSGYAFIAILIIPKAILQWLRRQAWVMLNKLGVTQFFRASYRYLVPEPLRQRWYMYQKWTLGRRQVRTHRRMREAAARSRQGLLARVPGKSSTRDAPGGTDETPVTLSAEPRGRSAGELPD